MAGWGWLGWLGWADASPGTVRVTRTTHGTVARGAQETTRTNGCYTLAEGQKEEDFPWHFIVFKLGWKKNTLNNEWTIVVSVGRQGIRIWGWIY